MGDFLNTLKYVVPLIEMIFVLGTIANGISCSFFLKNWKDGLGNQLLVILNIVDTFSCLAGALFLVVPFYIMNDSEYSAVYMSMKVCLMFFRIFLILTGIVTTFLCVVRTISITSPFYKLHKKTVYGVLATISIISISTDTFIALKYLNYTTAINSKNLLGLGLNCDYDELSKEKLPMALMLVELGILVLIVLISSAIAVKKLSKSVGALDADANTRRKRKAVITTVILCILFEVFNTMYILSGSYLFESCETLKKLYPVIVISLQMVPINSAINPLVYIVRTRKLRRYTLDLFRVKCRDHVEVEIIEIVDY